MTPRPTWPRPYTDAKLEILEGDTMKSQKRSDGWWIADVPAYDVDGETFTACGPYRTRDEADADLAGLTRFYKAHPEYLGDVIHPPEHDSLWGDISTPQGDLQTDTGSRSIQRTLFG